MSPENGQRADGLSIFTSFAAVDGRLAEELHGLLEALPDVNIRSALEVISAGQNWHEWLRRAARDSQYVIVVISPASINRAWMTWEAGALSATVGSQKILPIAFELDPAQLPSPWSQFQIRWGDRREHIVDLLWKLLKEVNKERAIEVPSRLNSLVQRYIDRIQQVLEERRREVPDAPAERARQAEPVTLLDEQDLRMLCELLFRLVVKGRLRPENLLHLRASLSSFHAFCH